MKRSVKGFPQYDDSSNIDSAAIHQKKFLPHRTDPTQYTEQYLDPPPEAPQEIKN